LLALWSVAHEGGPKLRQSDFVEYWVAARLFLSGANPYSPPEVSRLEASLHLSTRPRPWMMFNPPTALAVLWPFGLLPFSVAVAIWFVLQFGITFAASFWLWQIYRGSQKHKWLAVVLPGVSLPVYAALVDCQMTPLILLGIVTFLYLTEEQAFWFAGMALGLLALKPQLCLIFEFVLLLWCLREQKWKLLAGLAAATAILLLPVWFRPVLISQYRAVIPRIWDDAAPAWGGLLRAIFGYQYVWLQYLPVIPGMAWAAFYWKRHRVQWDWKQRLPTLLLVSILTAPYAWTYDEVILLPVFISAAVYVLAQNASRLARLIFAFYILVNVVMFLMNLAGLRDEWYLWNLPVWLGAYTLLERRLASPTLDRRASPIAP
jgi:hypothetical protein